MANLLAAPDMFTLLQAAGFSAPEANRLAMLDNLLSQVEARQAQEETRQ